MPNQRRAYRIEASIREGMYWHRYTDQKGQPQPNDFETKLNTILSKSERIVSVVYADGYFVVITDDYGLPDTP